MRENLGVFYDKTSDFQHEQFLTLVELIRSSIPDLGRITRMMDIGAGSGSRTRQCLDIFPALGHITAVEPDWDMIATARAQYGDPRIDYLEMPAEDLHKLAQVTPKFDSIISNWALHWVSGKEKMMADINAITAPGSYMMFSTCEALPSLLVMIDSYIRNEYRIPPGNSPFHYLTAVEWKNLLAASGWDVVGENIFQIRREIEDARKYVEHWFTASAAKFMYGRHLLEMSHLSFSDLIWMIQRAFPSAEFPEGLASAEDVMFIVARKRG